MDQNKNYTTKSNVEEYLGESITGNIDLYLLSAQKYIENYTKRQFYAGADDEARVYDGNNSQNLVIDPALEIETVELSTDDGVTWTELEDFISYPLNSPRTVRLSLRTSTFTKGLANVRVTGKFGWSECPPADIKFAATIIASGMYRNNSSKDVASERIGEYSVSYTSEQGWRDLNTVKGILDSYKKLL